MHFFNTLLLLALLCGSCVMSEMTIGQPLELSAISQLQPNHSSAQDVADLMGAPNQIVELGNKSAWLYEAQKERRAGLFILVFGTYGQDKQFDRCWVFFDENGLLTHIASSLESSTAEYNLSSIG
jgi:outer membrane protein assembly factor BamE (lipoprotein component of BamABCDE complex)